MTCPKNPNGHCWHPNSRRGKDVLDNDDEYCCFCDQRRERIKVWRHGEYHRKPSARLGDWEDGSEWDYDVAG